MPIILDTPPALIMPASSRLLRQGASDLALLLMTPVMRRPAAGVYRMKGSMWFDGAADYLSRTVTTSATFTFSCWVRRLSISAIMGLLEGGVQFNAADTITSFALTTTELFRDPTAWYHIHISNNGLLINGVSLGAVTTAALTNPDIGRTGTSYFNGLLADVILIDGTSVAATSFGEFNSHGVWRPIDPSGLTFGAKGFWLDFAAGAALGNDVSGNNNDWTLNSITSANASTDAPHDPLPMINFIDEDDSGTHSVGGTQSTGTVHALLTVGMASGKHAWKLTANATAAYGIEDDDETHNTYAATSGDVLEFELDLDAQTLKVRVNEGSPVTVITGLTSSLYYAYMADDFTLQQELNPVDTTFKQLAINDIAAPIIPDGSQHFAPMLYTGDGVGSGLGGNPLTGLNFAPDLVWIKHRNGTNGHMLFDVVRGINKFLATDVTSVEGTDTESLLSFDSGGFTLGSNAKVNTSGATFASWCWKANGVGANNTDGSITALVSANVTACFSICGYTGTGANATIGHGLGVVPSMIILKERTNDIGTWFVYHKDNTSAPETDYLSLDVNIATIDLNTIWNDTKPTASVFSIGTHDDVNGSGDTYVAYCFADVAGYSKFGSYVGTGNTDGAFIYLGFKPAFVMLKRTNSSGVWVMVDQERDPYNPISKYLSAEANGSEGTAQAIDFLATGFKLRNGNSNYNGSGGTYIYMAFASLPSGGLTATPITAR